MPSTMIKCPKCSNMCEFAEGRLFSFCNKCGSRLERDIDNRIMVYERSQEKDEDLLLVNERFEVCTNMTVPTRANFDIESLNYEIERMMDEFMTFCEVLKDIYGNAVCLSYAVQRLTLQHKVGVVYFTVKLYLFRRYLYGRGDITLRQGGHCRQANQG